MFVRLREYYRQDGHHAFQDTNSILPVYFKVLMSDGKDNNGNMKYGLPMYLLKADKGNFQEYDSSDYITQYDDKEVYRHPDFPGFNDDVRNHGNKKWGNAHGFIWLSHGDVEEIAAENNAAFKFLLKK